MTTTLDVHQTFPGPIEKVRTMLTDPGYIRNRSEQTGSISSEVTIVPGTGEVTLVTIFRVLPAELPAFASSLLGPNLEVTEHQTWAPVAADSCTAPFEVSISGRLSASGVITLARTGDHTTAHTTATIKSTVPFVGGKLEKMAKEQLVRYLAKDEELGQDWLSR